MREARDVFHLAIPASDLDEAQDFYVGKLGCHLARRYGDRITVDFFGDQLVCHLSDRIDIDPDMYPRHFGVTFRDREGFDAVLSLARSRSIAFYSPVTSRFDGAVEEHETFVLRDPSNNLIEFKHYRDPRMMY
ncbi:MAG: VOC family protein [Actinomycetota bacterium]|nr:VOC family protein [Actinomycetota bacterium]